MAIRKSERALELRGFCRMQFGDTAECNSALQVSIVHLAVASVSNARTRCGALTPAASRFADDDQRSRKQKRLQQISGRRDQSAQFDSGPNEIARTDVRGYGTNETALTVAATKVLRCSQLLRCEPAGERLLPPKIQICDSRVRELFIWNARSRRSLCKGNCAVRRGSLILTATRPLARFITR